MGKDNKKCPWSPPSQKAKYKNRPDTLYNTKEACVRRSFHIQKNHLAQQVLLPSENFTPDCKMRRGFGVWPGWWCGTAGELAEVRSDQVETQQR